MREDRLLPHLDAWLARLFAPDRIEEVASLVVAADAESHREEPAVTQARAAVVDCRRRLDRYLQALEAGMDPALIAARTAEVQRQQAAAEATLASAPPAPPPLTVEQVVDTLATLHRIPSLLADAAPEDRGELYRSLGVLLVYRRLEGVEQVKLQVKLGVDLERVGGGPCPSATRVTVFDLAA